MTDSVSSAGKLAASGAQASGSPFLYWVALGQSLGVGLLLAAVAFAGLAIWLAVPLALALIW